MLLRTMDDNRQFRRRRDKIISNDENEKQEDAAQPNPTTSNASSDANRLWLIVKHMKASDVNGKCELRGGEKFKLGRIVFHVKELVNDKFQHRC